MHGTGDADGIRDVFQFLGGVRTLVSEGTQTVTFGGISADGTVVYYATRSRSPRPTATARRTSTGTTAPRRS